MDEPLDELLSFAERTYVRMQAEQLINDCLQRGDPDPFYELLAELILAGAPSLAILREVLDVIRVMKSELSRNGMSVRQDLIQAMSEFGIYLPRILSAEAPDAFRQICSRSLRDHVRNLASNLELEDINLLEEICIEAGGKVTSIAGQMAILTQLEASVHDWMEGLAYEAAHEVDIEGERRGSLFNH
ncbi:MAG: hypothetical protein P8X64_15180 [Anaerolineales bacterium]|jgi:hypothetical protein